MRVGGWSNLTQKLYCKCTCHLKCQNDAQTGTIAWVRKPTQERRCQGSMTASSRSHVCVCVWISWGMSLCSAPLGKVAFMRAAIFQVVPKFLGKCIHSLLLLQKCHQRLNASNKWVTSYIKYEVGCISGISVVCILQIYKWAINSSAKHMNLV